MAGQNVERHLQQIGLYPLSRTTGIGLFETALCEDDTQLVALWGIRSKLTQAFLNASNIESESDSGTTEGVDESALSQKVETYLKETLAEVTELPITEIDSDLRFEEFGVDSIVVTDFNLRLEKGFGPLPKTLLFEFPNFRRTDPPSGRGFQATDHSLSWQSCFAGIASLEQLRCSIWMEFG